MEVTTLVSTKQILDMADVELVLDYFGINYEPIMTNEVRFICPWHKEDEPSLFFNTIKKIYHCLGCHKTGTIISFVQDLKQCSLPDAIDVLLRIHGETKDNYIDEDFVPLTEQDKQNREAVKKLAQINHVVLLDEIDNNWVKQCQTVDIPYLKERGFNGQVLQTFELGFCDNGEFSERVVIPIHDEFGRLVGFSTRKTTTEKDQKYKHKAHLATSKLLYNLHRAKHFVDKMPMMICEGFSDVWRAAEFGYPCCVAVLGDHMSLDQEKLALKYGYSFIIAFDNDSAGRDGARKVIKSLKAFAKVFLFLAPEGKDIGDLTKDEFKKCLSTAKEVI